MYINEMKCNVMQCRVMSMYCQCNVSVVLCDIMLRCVLFVRMYVHDISTTHDVRITTNISCIQVPGIFVG